MTEEEKLQRFYTECTEAAKKDSDAQLEAFSKELDDAFEAHKKQKMQETDAWIANERGVVERQLKREYSEKQQKIRQREAARQDLIREKLFKRVREKLLDAKKRPEYLEFLVKRTEESKKIAGTDPMTLYIDPSDQKFQDALEARTGVRALLSREPFLGGTRAVVRSKNILIDYSLQSLMEDERERYAFD